jgi:hypothetical protein
VVLREPGRRSAHRARPDLAPVMRAYRAGQAMRRRIGGTLSDDVGDPTRPLRWIHPPTVGSRQRSVQADLALNRLDRDDRGGRCRRCPTGRNPAPGHRRGSSECPTHWRNHHRREDRAQMMAARQRQSLGSQARTDRSRRPAGGVARTDHRPISHKSGNRKPSTNSAIPFRADISPSVPVRRRRCSQLRQVGERLALVIIVPTLLFVAARSLIGFACWRLQREFWRRDVVRLEEKR